MFRSRRTLHQNPPAHQESRTTLKRMSTLPLRKRQTRDNKNKYLKLVLPLFYPSPFFSLDLIVLPSPSQTAPSHQSLLTPLSRTDSPSYVRTSEPSKTSFPLGPTLDVSSGLRKGPVWERTAVLGPTDP